MRVLSLERMAAFDSKSAFRFLICYKSRIRRSREFISACFESNATFNRSISVVYAYSLCSASIACFSRCAASNARFLSY